MDDLVEIIAKCIYESEGGLTPEEFEEITSVCKREWICPDGMYYPDMKYDYLEDHEREDYRYQAKIILMELFDRNFVLIKSSGRVKE